MLKHMVDRSNAWRFEILNSSYKTRGSFKFLMRSDRVGTVLESIAEQAALLTLPLTVSDKKRFQHPNNHRAVESPSDTAQSSYSSKDPFIPSHICRQ
ncbi:hypothetical protein N341_09399, partial [Tyto alba]